MRAASLRVVPTESSSPLRQQPAQNRKVISILLKLVYRHKVSLEFHPPMPLASCILFIPFCSSALLSHLFFSHIFAISHYITHSFLVTPCSPLH